MFTKTADGRKKRFIKFNLENAVLESLRYISRKLLSKNIHHANIDWTEK